jgi:hypothetical protein
MKFALIFGCVVAIFAASTVAQNLQFGNILLGVNNVFQGGYLKRMKKIYNLNFINLK